MIKSFEEFINENYNEMPSYASFSNEEYGAPLFNEISESLMDEIYDSINEGKLIIDANMLEEGLFDKIGGLFKKGMDKISNKSVETEMERKSDNRSAGGRMLATGKVKLGDFKTIANGLKNQTDEAILQKMMKICDSAAELCENLSKKEEKTYKTISEKMTAINEAVDKFMKETIAKINEIVVDSKNKISDVISTVMLFCAKMMDIAKDALKTIGKGVVMAFVLPFVLAFSVYKGVLKVCEMLIEKVKDGAKIVKEAFTNIKTSISEWVSKTLKDAKEMLVSAGKSTKDGAESAYKAIGKTYLTIVAVLGQLVSDTKDAIKNAYNEFVDCLDEMSEEVKSFVSEKWATVSKWYSKTKTSFAEGVKNVWDKIKTKVTDAIDSAKDAYTSFKKYGNNTLGEIEEWSDEKQKDVFKASLKYAADKWGKDEVNSWIK